MSARSKTTAGYLAGAALVLATLAAPAAAEAAVRYTFVGSAEEEGAISFTYLAPDFISAWERITPDTCSVANPAFACETMEFQPTPTSFPASQGDFLSFGHVNIDGSGGGGGFYFFQPGAFGAVGFYSNADWPINDFDHPDCCAGNAGPATLKVEFVGSAVPEPATWAMMIAGFGLAGAGLRRRRASVVPA